jgi:hypothetical protein
VSRRSPSPSQTVTYEQDPATVLDTSMKVDGSPAGASPPHTVTSLLPLSNESHRHTSPTTTTESIHSLLHGPVSPLGAKALSKPNISPDAALNHPDLIVSLSPAGQPTIANSQVLTEHERTMSLEQWIRQEISLSHDRLLTDGRRQIELFQTKAAELRKCIEEL